MDSEKETLLNVHKTPMFQLKKRMMLMALFMRYFFCGLEYSIIMPTALLYMESLNGSHAFMGLVVGLYPLAAIFTLPLFGYLYDRTKRMRELLLILNMLQIIGNFVYAIPYSKWLPLVGRFLSGLGDGFISLTVGEVTYLFDESNRLGIFSLLELGRVLGLVIGPTVNFVIEKWTIHLSRWQMDNKSLPGFIMGCCWLLMQLVSVICVHNLALELINKFNLNDSPYFKKKVDGEIADNIGENIKNGVRWRKRKKEGSENQDSDSDSLFAPDFFETSEDEKEDVPDELTTDIKEDVSSELTADNKEDVPSERTSEDIFPIAKNDTPPPKIKEKFRLFMLNLAHKIRLYLLNLIRKLMDCINVRIQQSHLDELFYVEFIVLFIVDLVLWYTQTTFEILCPYITEFEYKWGPEETGAIYMVGGVVIIIIFILMFIFRNFFAKKDVYLIVFALVLTEISLALMIYEVSPHNIKTRMAIFMVIALFVFMSIPLNMVCLKTLLTRLARPGLQGTLQGISSSIARLAMVAGPLIGTYVFNERQAYGATMGIVCFTAIICLFLTYEKIVKREKETREKIRF